METLRFRDLANVYKYVPERRKDVFAIIKKHGYTKAEPFVCVTNAFARELLGDGHRKPLELMRKNHVVILGIECEGA